MINEDIRHIIEAELREGEALLWTEKVDEDLREKWILKSIKHDRWVAFPFLIFSVFFVSIVARSPWNHHPDAVLWIVILGAGLLLPLGGLFLFVSLLPFRSFFGRKYYNQKRPFNIYALTNERLLYFGLDNDMIIELEASNPKKAELLKRWSFPNKWKPLCLMISPVGLGIWKMAELYFLPDFENSKKQILSVINAKEATP